MSSAFGHYVHKGESPERHDVSRMTSFVLFAVLYARVSHSSESGQSEPAMVSLQRAFYDWNLRFFAEGSFGESLRGTTHF